MHLQSLPTAEGGHHIERASLYRSLVGRQIQFTQNTFRDLHVALIEFVPFGPRGAPESCAIADEMFRRGKRKNGLARTHGIAILQGLHAFDVGGTEPGDELRLFTKALIRASPA